MTINLTKTFRSFFSSLFTSSPSVFTFSLSLLPFSLLLLTFSLSLLTLPIPAYSAQTSTNLEKLEVDPTTGTVSLPIAIDVPAGRGGVLPNISLIYNSSSPNGVAGVGWILELGRIERSLKKGKPQYNNNDIFVLKQAGSGQELIETSTNEFRPKLEGSFMKMTAYPADNKWIVTDKKGMKYTFGDGSNYRTGPGAVFDQTFCWLLKKVEDLQGNTMEITYQNDIGIKFPLTIDYTSNPQQNLSAYAHVAFNYQTRTDQITTYIPGFEVTTTKRLQNIEVSAAGSLLRRYEFNYDNSSESFRSRLIEVQRVGADGASELPATDLSYSNGQTSFPTTSTNLTHHPGGGLGAVNSYGLTTIRLLDMNGDGLTELVNTGNEYNPGNYANTAGNPTANYRVYPNTGGDFGTWQSVPSTGDGWNLADPDVRLIDLNGDGLLDQIKGDDASGTYYVKFNNGNYGFTPGAGYAVTAPGHTISSSPTGLPILQFIDMNGDGYPDMVDSYVGNDQQYKIYFNQFNPANPNTIEFGNAPLANNPNIPTGYALAQNSPNRGFTNPDINLVDLNGDGLLDVLWSSTTNVNGNWTVWINNGGNGFLPSVQITNHPNHSLSHQNYLNYIDMNADGLTDLVDARNDGYQIWINNGNLQFNSPPLTITNHPSEGTNNTSIRFIDMNGDGFADILDGRNSNASWYIYLNDQHNGFNLEAMPSGNHPDTYLNDNNVQIVDINGDFKMDFLYTHTTPSGLNYEVWIQDSETETSRPDVLVAMDNNQGATLSLTYQNTPVKNLVGPGFKFATSTMLFNTVKESTTSVINPLNLTSPDSYTTTYDYMNGVWDHSDREFRGFGMVQVTGPDGNYVKTDYLQDDDYKGRVSQQTSYLASGEIAGKTVNQWDKQVVNVAPVSNFIYLKRVDNFLYQNNAPIKRTAEEYYFQETPQLGDLTKTIQYGEVDLPDPGTDIGSDKKTIETDYVSNATNHVLGLPSEVRVKDNNDQLIRKSWFYYDNNATPTATPGIGQLTKKEEWLPTTANPNPSAGATDNPKTTYTYDATGNLLSTTDALNHTTSITYDTNYKVFPKATTNAMNHQVQNEYYGINGVPLSANGTTGVWGQLKSSTDPNNQVGTKIYDTFGRTVKSVGPMDTVSQPTSESVYTLNSNYSKLRRKARLNNGAAGTVDVVEYFDGLGRSIQTKQKSGTAGQYIVGGQVEYDANGRVIKKYIAYFTSNDLDTMDPVDPNKPHSTITYDDKGRVIRSTNPDGTYATIDYDGWTTTTIDENGHKQKSYADSQGRLIKKEEYLGADGRGSPTYPQAAFTLYATTQYVYDADGNLTQVIDDHNNITTVNYDKLGRKTSMVDPDMGTWSYEYDANGNLKRQTDAQSKVLEFNYDAINRLDTKDSPITVNTDVTYQYDNAAVNYSKGRLTQAAYFDHTNFNYDPIGRETSSTKTIDGVNYTVNRTYDALDRLKNVQYPDGTNLYYAYNDAGQVVAVAPSALTNTTWTSGTPAGTVVSAPFAHYKLNDNTSTTTVADTGTGNHSGTGSVVSSLLSAVGKINQSFELSGNAQNVDVSAMANAVKTDTTGTISFWVKRDALGTGDVFSVANTSGIPSTIEFYVFSGGTAEIYLDGYTGAISRKFDYQYYGLIPSGEWVHITLVQDGTSFKLYKNGDYVPWSNSLYQNQPTYDPGSWFDDMTSTNLLGIQNAFIGKWQPSNVSYNDFHGKVDDFRYYSNQALTATQVAALYNTGNGTEDETITTPAVPAGSSSTGVGADAYITNVLYNASGQITSIVYGSGVQTNYTYDPISQRLTHLLTSHISPFTLIQDLQYTYDPAGNILTIVDNINTGSQTFAYDALNRLVTATGQYCSPAVGSSVPSTCTKTYQYDTIGNIIQKDGKTYTYGQNGSGPHAVTSLSDGSTFAYDANGNMIQKVDGVTSIKWDYEYNLENRLTKVYRNGSLLMEYEYDGDGGRVKRVDYSATVNDVVGLAFASDVDIAPTVTYYVGSLFEKDTANALETKYIYFGSQRIASVDNKGRVRYLLGDHLGSTNVVLDASGTATELIEYEPYGDFSRHQYFGDPSDTAHHYFTAQRFESQIGLYDYNARFYDPKLGRFIQADTQIPYFGDGESLNRYTYVRNNPVNFVDPDGHIFFAILIGAAIGAATSAATGGDILMGALTGAISGALFGFVGGMGLEGSALIAGHAIAGALSGGIGAVITGGDPVKGALIGGLSAGVTEYLGQGGILPSFSKDDTFLEFSGKFIQRAIVGGAIGGVTSSLTGSTFLDGFIQGMYTSAIAMTANHWLHDVQEFVENDVFNAEGIKLQSERINAANSFVEKAGRTIWLAALLVDAAGNFIPAKAGVQNSLKQVGKVNLKYYKQLEKQLERNGEESIHKSLKSFEKRLSQHEKKVEGLIHKSSVYKEIKTFRNSIETIHQFIRDKNL